MYDSFAAPIRTVRAMADNPDVQRIYLGVE